RGSGAWLQGIYGCDNPRSGPATLRRIVTGLSRVRRLASSVGLFTTSGRWLLRIAASSRISKKAQVPTQPECAQSTVRNSRGGSSHVSHTTRSEMADWHRCDSGSDYVCHGRYRCAQFREREPFLARRHDPCPGIAESQSVAWRRSANI